MYMNNLQQFLEMDEENCGERKAQGGSAAR